MIGLVKFLGRLGAGLVGLALFVALWQALPSSFEGLMSVRMAPGARVLAFSQLIAVALLPLAFLSLAFVPRYWLFAAIPVAWAAVATILVYPRSLDFLF